MNKRAGKLSERNAGEFIAPVQRQSEVELGLDRYQKHLIGPRFMLMHPVGAPTTHRFGDADLYQEVRNGLR